MEAQVSNIFLSTYKINKKISPWAVTTLDS